MENLVVWTGPVAEFQVPGATLPGARTVFIGCCGDLTPPCQPPTCPDIGNAVMGSPSALFGRVGVPEQNVGELFLAGFSAGGSILKRVLENQSYRVRVTAVHAADATYTSTWIDAAQRIPPHVEGYVLYGVDVAQGPGDKLFVATASPAPNKNWATGVENLGAIRREIERRTGRGFVERSNFFGITPEPERVYQLGNVILAEYPMRPLGHGHTTIAGQVWQKIIQPWLAKGKGPVAESGGLPGQPPVTLPPPGPPGGIGIGEIALGLVALAGGYFIVRKLMERRG